MKPIRIVLAAYLMVATSWAGAYELATHGAITYNAYLKSNLNTDSTLFKSLGIDGLLVSPNTASNPFGITYYDVQGNTISERYRDVFEGGIIEAKPLSVNPLTLPGWLMRGAIREDDGGYALFGNTWKLGKGGEPYDDPYGNINRFCNHFFRPLSLRGSGKPWGQV